MSTVGDIINYADRYYPNAVSSANKIADLNLLNKEIFNRIKRMTNDFEMGTLYTVADQLTYTLPSYCKIENIIKVEISSVPSDDITVSTTWDRYKFAGLMDNIDSGNFYGQVTDTTIAITSDALPVTVTDHEIRIYFYKQPTELTSIYDTPELDPIYHNILRYGLLQAIACQGQNPDVEIANYWQRKYDENIAIIEADLADKFNTVPLTTTQGEEWY